MVAWSLPRHRLIAQARLQSWLTPTQGDGSSHDQGKGGSGMRFASVRPSEGTVPYWLRVRYLLVRSTGQTAARVLLRDPLLRHILAPPARSRPGGAMSVPELEPLAR